MIGFLLRALAVAACLAQPAWAAGAEPPASPAASVKEARSLIATGRYDAALPILRRLAKSPAAPGNARFLLGLAAIGASQQKGLAEDRREALLDEAIAVLRALLVARPGLVRVRLELARAFFHKGEDRLARRHFEQVLAGKPPAAVALNVNRFLAAIRARKRWSLRVGMALAPDSNIGADSGERVIHIDTPLGRLPFSLDDPEPPSSGVGVSAWLGGEYEYPLGRPGAGSAWRLRAGGDLSRREYRASEFDRLTVAGHVGPRWLIGRGSDLSLLLTGQHHWTGSGLSRPSHRAIGLRIEGRHRLTRRTTLTARLSRAERRYDADSYRDGPVADISLGARWIASPTLRLDAGLGWGARGPRPGSGARPAAGCASGRRRCCPTGSPSAARARCAGPTGRATGSRIPGAARSAAT